MPSVFYMCKLKFSIKAFIMRLLISHEDLLYFIHFFYFFILSSLKFTKMRMNGKEPFLDIKTK